MKHSEVRDLLVDLAEGSLKGPRLAAVKAHVRVCVECDRWLTTYSLIQAVATASAQHPDADTIAAYALEPADLPPRARASVAAHLEQCKSCSREYRLTRQALAGSRPVEPGATVDELSSTDGLLPTWATAGLLAATMLVALMLVRPQPPAPQVLTDGVINDHRVVESEQRLLAGDLQLAESSELELRAPQGVVLGDGFSVKKGARLSVSTVAKTQ